MPKGWYCASTATPFFTVKMVQEARKYHVKGAAAVQGRQDAALIYQQLKTIIKQVVLRTSSVNKCVVV